MKVKIAVDVWSKSKGNKFWLELARASSYRGFDLPGVNRTKTICQQAIKASLGQQN